MRLGGNAAYLTEVTSREQVVEAVQWADEQQLPAIMVGSGSNIVWTDDGFPGLVLINRIESLEIMGAGSPEQYLTVGSGVIWDDFVAQTVERGLTGIEFLSLIPGSVGATPVQNVGAYGQEVSNTIVTIEAYDRVKKELITLPAGDCQFGYRTSRFKTTDRGRFFITTVTFFLRTGNPLPPYYSSLEKYRMEMNLGEMTPQKGRDAVIEIRKLKLPDPAKVANNGSFFANPIVSIETFSQLIADFPELVYWKNEDNEQVKLSAAWLIDRAGFSDFYDEATGMCTWPTQSLVLVNKNAKSTQDLLAFRQKIIDAVYEKFGITLVQEPELIGV